MANGEHRPFVLRMVTTSRLTLKSVAPPFFLDHDPLLLCLHSSVSNSLSRMLQLLEMHQLGGKENIDRDWCKRGGKRVNV